ncbi:MAG: AAA family ATPase [Planctomycetota bacterium]
MSGGLTISGIRVIGPQKPDAEIDFVPGANLVYGVSNTGKTFAFQAIDFCLGGRDRPKTTIPEASGYTSAQLGLISDTGEQYIVERDFSSGNARVYTAPFDHGGTLSNGKDVAQTAASTNESISSVVLGWCGLGGRVTRRNKDGKTGPLSFREMSRFVCINESYMLSEDSLGRFGKGFDYSPWLSCFSMLLTGTDASGVSEVASRAIRTARAEASRLELQRLLKRCNDELAELGESTEEVQGRLKKLEAATERAIDEQSQLQTRAREQDDLIRQSRADVEDAARRSRQASELLNRFELLQQSYKTDLVRLEAIQEAGTFMSIMPEEICPTCGTELVQDGDSRDVDDSISISVQSARAEHARIVALDHELSRAIEQVRGDGLQARKDYATAKLRFDGAKDRKALELAPRLEALFNDLRDLRAAEKKAAEAQALSNQITELEARIRELDGANRQPAPKASSSGIPSYEVSLLCDVIGETLETWGYPGFPRITWDGDFDDFRFDNQLRSDFGKGYRAFLLSAFVTSLMRYCKQRQIAHPRFVVLDSPLVTLHQDVSGPATSSEDGEFIQTDMKDAFFRDIARLSEDDGQIIIFDNDAPPDDLGPVHSHVFVGPNRGGRCGFFPAAT